LAAQAPAKNGERPSRHHTKGDRNMDVFEAIDRRHSYRAEYVDKPVPREDLQKIVQAGIQAPSGCNAQSTTFVIVDAAAVMAQIREVVPVKSPALIACIVDPTPVYQELSFEIEDCAAAVENMLLAIAALGYATVWLDGVLRREGVAQRLGAILNVPEGRRVQIILPVGVPAEQCKQKERKTFEQRAWFNRYEG
jgi:nitroreductase